MTKPFEQYDRENPHLWKEFEKLTFEAIRKGFKHFGSKGICELIRWNTKQRGNDGYKINNIYTSDYSRKFMSIYPQYEGFFITRETKN